MNSHCYQIVAIDNDPKKTLTTPSHPLLLNQKGLFQAQETIKKLKEILRPLAPAAGLAAPQIGVNEQIFIFSWDRRFENIQAAVNPTFIPLKERQETCWEACFSAILCKDACHIAYVPCYTKIQAHFYDELGRLRTQILENFAARVFQHEYDHLQGIVNIYKPDVEMKSFPSLQEMDSFLSPLKAQIDTVRYIAPIEK